MRNDSKRKDDMEKPDKDRHRCAKCGEWYNSRNINDALHHAHHKETFKAILSWSNEMLDDARGKEFDVTVINLN